MSNHDDNDDGARADHNENASSNHGESTTGNDHESAASIFPNWKNIFVSREDFLKFGAIACGGLIVLIAAIPSAAFFLGYLFVPRERKWVSLGPGKQFKDGETINVEFESPYSLPFDGITAKRTAWLRKNSDDHFVAFATNCTHLGCPVRWEQGAELFLCPCHGGVFYSNGDVAAGPPPRPLHQYPLRIQNGTVEILVEPILTQG